MILDELITILQLIAPLREAEPWDNVGLLLGDSRQSVTNVLITIDYTADVAAEAIDRKCNVIIAYHPPLFKPINRLTADGPQSLLFDAARRGVAIYSPHTAWDAAEGGANDFLADVLMLRNTRPLRLNPSILEHCRLVTYVPTAAVDKLADALFAAGAGAMDRYSRCSFRSTGVGTFQGAADSNPSIGKPGEYEKVDEIKLEMIVPLTAIEPVLAALKANHPYETPAYDFLPLLPPPGKVGMGRVGSLPGELTGEMLLNHVKHELGMTQLLVAGPIDKLIRRAACCAGAGDDLLNDAINSGADLYLTGEIRHHDALRAAAGGMVVACTLHSNSERGSLKRLQTRLATAFPSTPFYLSQADQEPFAIR